MDKKIIKINDSYLEFEINLDNVRITNIKVIEENIKDKLIDKLLIYAYHFNKPIVNLDGSVIDNYKIKRFIKIGSLRTGKLNNICDVDGVSVGHKSVHDGPYNTGITVIKPHQGNIFREKVVGAYFSFNGFGKSIGSLQVEELGTIETNIVFTTTLNVGKVANAVVNKALEDNKEIGETTGTVNPLVMECNDGGLNKSRDRILDLDDYYEALNNCSLDFAQGDVGAGCGMECHGFKGGIGSSSRVVSIDGKDYTVGVILNSNFGSSNGEDLIINGHKYKNLKEQDLLMDEKGSIVVCVATDAPLNERQLKRLLRRVEIGIGRTGSFAGNGSGDVFVGFSTANKRSHFNDQAVVTSTYFNDDYINPLFRATVEAVEEAVLNSLLFAHHLKGYKKEIKCLSDEMDKIIDLLDGEIICD